MTMDEREALHTAARRYCMERETAIWREIEAEAARERHLPSTALLQALETSRRLGGRWDVIQGILRRIEGVTSGTFVSVDTLRAYLTESGRTASLEEDTRRLKEAAGQRVVKEELSEEAERAGNDERARFCAYIENMQPEVLRDVRPLPHHRLLGEREAARLWRRLQRKWQIPSQGYWWPLGSQEVPPPHVLAFNDWEFHKHVPLSLLRGWLGEARAKSILLFDNDNPGEDYEMDLELFASGGGERYWTSPKMDWVIYYSHENSVTIGGEWLLNLVKRVLPEWEEHLRTTHLPPGAL